MADEIRDLASQLAQAADLGFAPTTLIKGVITASNPTGTPPNVSLTLSGDDTTPIDLVRYIDSYSPVVGDTVLVGKQGTDIFVLGQMNDTGTGAANGWTAPSLGSGFSTNGSSNGNVEYRLVIDHGERKVQWRGGVGISSGQTAMCTLPADVRPASRRSLIAVRDSGGGANSVQVDFNTNGTVAIVGGTAAPAGSGSGSTGNASNNHTHPLGSSDVRLSGYLSQAGSDLGHAHGLGQSGGHDVTHSHSVTSDVTVDAPVFVSFNGLEYFL